MLSCLSVTLRIVQSLGMNGFFIICPIIFFEIDPRDDRDVIILMFVDERLSFCFTSVIEGPFFMR